MEWSTQHKPKECWDYIKLKNNFWIYNLTNQILKILLLSQLNADMLLFSIHPSSSKQNPGDHLCFAVRSRELENKWHEYNSDIYQQPPRIRWPVIISDQETDPAVQKIQMLDWPHCVQGCNMNRKMWNPGKKKKKEKRQTRKHLILWPGGRHEDWLV